MAAPARGLALDRRPDQRLAGGQGPARADLTTTPYPDDHGRTTQSDPDPTHEQETMIKMPSL